MRNIFFIIFVGLLLNNATVMGMKRKRKEIFSADSSCQGSRPFKRRKLEAGPLLGADDVGLNLSRFLTSDKAIFGLQALLDAAWNHDAYRVIFLLASGVDPNVQSNFTGRKPFYRAIRRNNCEIVKIFLEYGADVNKFADCIGSTTSKTSLHCAVDWCHNFDFRIVDLLLRYGANPNLTTLGGCTPFHKAVDQGKTKLAKRLLVNGANVSTATAAGCNSFDFIDNNNEEMKQLFFNFIAKKGDFS